MPPEPDSTQLLCLNCFVDGDLPDQTFPVEVPKTKNVGILKDLIKEKKAPDLDHVSASKLKLFLVSEFFLIDDLASKQPPTNSTPLRPNKRLSSLFADDLSEDDLHIWVKAPPSMSPPCSSLNLSNISEESDPVQLLSLNCFLLGEKPHETYLYRFSGLGPNPTRNRGRCRI